MRHPFAPDPKEIGLLEPLDFTDLVNRLLFAEAGRSGIPPSDIAVTRRDNVPDGGTDARVLAPTTSTSRWIKTGLSMYQFKKGKITKTILQNEWKKASVQEAIQQGAWYVWVTGVDLNVRERAVLEACLTELFERAKLQTRFVLLNASQLCEWVAEVPSLYIALGRPIGDLLNHEQWGRAAFGFDIALQAAQAQQTFHQELAQMVAPGAQRTHIHVDGPSGGGKSRLVYEALAGQGIAQRVLYAAGPDALVGAHLFGDLRNRPLASAILVVDHCGGSHIEQFSLNAAACTGLTLITVGESSRMRTPGTERAALLRVPELGEQQLQAVVHAAAPSLHSQATTFIAYHAGGNAALAVRLARALEARGVDTMSAVDAASTVEGQLTALIADTLEERVAEALALLQQVGYRGAVIGEGRAVADFVGIPWDEMQRIAERLQQRGLVRVQGRYWIVEPPLLAVHLASRVWRRKESGMLALAKQLATLASQQAFWRRFADLGEDPVTSSIAIRMLQGPEPLCRTISDLDDQAFMLRLFVSVAPAVVLYVLERVLAGKKQASAISGGTWHQVVWALEHLLWFPATYNGAVDLLRVMALTEVERPPVNAARQAWRTFFQQSLSGTSVPALHRHDLLAKVLSSEEENEQLLAVDGIGASLASWQTRSGGPERGGTLLPAEWQPQSYEDLLAIVESALILLDRALADPKPRVHLAATRVLIGAARDLVRIGLPEEAIDRLEKVVDARLATNWEEGDQIEIREVLELLRMDKSILMPTQHDRLRELHARLVGTDFGSRLRYWVGRWTIRQSGPSPEESGFQALESLAQEATEDPSLLEPEFAWLYSEEAYHAGEFAQQLGEHDVQGHWQGPLIDAARCGQEAGFIALYLIGRARTCGSLRLDELLDHWAQEERDLAQVVREATARGEPSDASALRLIDLVDRGWLPIWTLGSLTWGTWPGTVHLSTAYALLERLSGDGEERSGAFALGLLDRRLDAAPADCSTFAPLAIPLLKRQCMVQEDPVAFRWNQVASAYVAMHPHTIAEAIIAWLRAHDIRATGQDASRLNLLTRAAQIEPEAVWGPLAPLLGDANWARYGDLEELSLVLAALPINLLLDWAAEDVPFRAPRLARAIPMGGKDIPSLARELLIRFGPDRGLGMALDPQRRSQSFYGDYESYLKEQLARVTAWTQDPHPTVARWTRQLVVALQTHIADVEMS